MKYKLAGIIACVLAFAAAVGAVFVTRAEDKERMHQHLRQEEKAECSHRGDMLCTHLPLVKIDTGGAEIPGAPITDENHEIIGYTNTEDGADYITARLDIIDNSGRNNHISDTPRISSAAQLHIRGNSSRFFEKPGYAVRLVIGSGENNPQAVMGMDAHHEWVLHGPYLDKSLMRNYLWYNIAGEIMDYAPNVRFCELMLNGEYRGLYLMTETISAGRDGARLKLSVDKKDNSYTGYLLRLDRGSRNEIKNLNTFSAYAKRTAAAINIEYPGADNLTEEIRRSAELDFSDFEKALYSYDFDSEEYGYSKYIDVGNFVDYFIINEVACNYDAGIYSTYIYKDIDGKYRLCVWDFNNACDNYQEQEWRGETFEMDTRLWFNMLLKSEDFTERCIDRYRELRKTVLSDEYLNDYIDETIAYLGGAADRNNARWAEVYDRELLHPEDRNIRSFREGVAQLKDFLHRRTAWLDENIESLRQYSAASKIKKYSEGTE